MKVVEFVGVEKAYPGVRALRGVSLDVRAGEVLGLVGKNGAGKSTLIKLLAGVEHRDAGDIRIDGQAVGHAYNAGSAPSGAGFLVPGVGNGPPPVCHREYPSREQVREEGRHFCLLGRESREGASGDRSDRTGCGCHFSGSQTEARPATSGDDCQGPIPRRETPCAGRTDGRSVGEETEQLFRIIRELRRQGRSVIYVSHRLKEVADITDRVAVMRDGSVALDRPTSEVPYDALVAAITGGEEFDRHTAAVDARARKPVAGEDEVVLSVRGLSRPHAEDGISFEVRSGEIVGLVGLVGSGRSELVRMIAGVDPKGAGSVYVKGQKADIRSPYHAMKAGIGLLPENRREEGLILKFGVRENTTMASLRKHRVVSWLPVPSRSSERRATRRAIDTFVIVCHGPEQVVATLSGGNQQKVVVAKWMERDVTVVVFDEPTHGIDVHAKTEIRSVIRELASHGKAIIVIASEFSDLVSMCDRMLVMNNNRLCGELSGEQMQEARMVELCYANFDTNA